MPTSHPHYPPLPGASTTRPSPSRWSPEASVSPSTATLPAAAAPASAPPPPPPPPPARQPPSPTTLRAGILEHARSLLGGGGGGPSSGSGSVRGQAGGQEAADGEEPEGEQEEEQDEFRYEERQQGQEREREASWAAAASAAHEGARGAASRWAAASAGGAVLAATGPASVGEVAPADSDPHAAPRGGGGGGDGGAGGAGSSAARWLARAEAVRARAPALSSGSRASGTGDEATATATERPSTPDRAAHRSRTATADSLNAPSTSSFLSSPFSLISGSTSPPTSRTALLAGTARTSPAPRESELRDARSRIVSLERALSAHSASDRMRAEALEMREAALVSEVKSLRDDAAARDGQLRAAQDDAERAKAELERCVARLVATEGIVGALEGQEDAGRSALELVGDALDLGVELHGAAHGAATRAVELDRALSMQGTLGERMKGLLLDMRRGKVELEGRVRERDEELAALRARDERHDALLRRVHGVLVQLDGDALIEPVGDELPTSDPAAGVEAALSRLADLRDRTPTRPRTASPASSATTTSDPLSALSHANEELQAELAEAGVTAERRIKLLVREIQKVTTSKDAEIAELRRRVDEATSAADEAQRRRVYAPHELVHLSSSPLVASSAPQLLQASLLPEIAARQPGDSVVGTSESLARIVKLSEQLPVLRSRVAQLEADLTTCRAEQRALKAHNAELEQVNGEAYAVMDELARALERARGAAGGGD
ncbi:hypothetical protein JCM3775_000068 [Rhodotorula graminis]